MNHRVAAIKAGRPSPRFATHNPGQGERHLGLRRSSPAPISAARARRPQNALNALRRAARSLGGDATARRPPARIACLRQSNSMTWSRRAQAARRLARPRSAAPWRG